MTGPRARDLAPLLEGRLALLCGGRDRRGRAVLTVPPPSPAPRERGGEEYRKVLEYLTSVPR